MKRRDAVRTLAVAPLAAAFRWTPESVREASARAREALARGTTYEPKQFTAHEWETVRVLVDLILGNDQIDEHSHRFPLVGRELLRLVCSAAGQRLARPGRCLAHRFRRPPEGRGQRRDGQGAHRVTTLHQSAPFFI